MSGTLVEDTIVHEQVVKQADSAGSGLSLGGWDMNSIALAVVVVIVIIILGAAICSLLGRCDKNGSCKSGQKSGDKDEGGCSWGYGLCALLVWLFFSFLIAGVAYKWGWLGLMVVVVVLILIGLGCFWATSCGDKKDECKRD